MKVPGVIDTDQTKVTVVDDSAEVFVKKGTVTAEQQVKAVAAIDGGYEAAFKSAPKAKVNRPKPLFDPNNKSHVKIEAAIRESLRKPEGELFTADLTQVRGLTLRQKQLTDIRPLANLKQLRSLNLVGNGLTDVNALAGCKELSFVSLDSNGITDISGLAGLTKIHTLLLNGNKLADKQLKHLEGLNRLFHLRLSSNKLTSISSLAGLTKLTYLGLYNTDVPRAEIEEFQKALPKCEIPHNAPE